MAGPSEKTEETVKTYSKDKPRGVDADHPDNAEEENNFAVLEALAEEIQVLESKLVLLGREIAKLLEEDKRILKVLNNRSKLLRDLEKHVFEKN